MALHCSECGAENLDTAQLCFSCGTPLEGGDADELIGTVLFDSYRVTKVLGSGGMAVVYLGVNQLTGQEVAIKMLPPELAAYAEVKTRFLEEARTLAKLEHSNIVHLINFAEDDGRLCLVMQYAEGETLEDEIDRMGRLEPTRAVQTCMLTLKGLEHAHDNDVVHRDIKPSNIMVRPDGSVKVTDFGIAKITRDSKLTQTGQTMGTVRYMAPEQVRGKDIDHRTDLYALGISLYESLVGEPPFDGESQFEVMQMHLTTAPRPPRETGAQISAELEQVILKGIAKPMEERFQDARAFRAALRATPEGRAVPRGTRELEVSQAPTVAADPLPRRSRSWILVVVLAVLVLAAGGMALLLLRDGDGGSPGTAGKTGKTGKNGRTSQARETAGGPARRPQPALPAKHPVLEALSKQLEKWPVAKLFSGPRPLFLYADASVDAERIARGYRQAQQAYGRLLREQQIPHELAVRPLTLVLLSNERLNDEALWSAVPSKREGPDFYVPGHDDSLLFVVGDKPYTERQLRYSVALHLCPLKVENARCIKLAQQFEKNRAVDFLP